MKLFLISGKADTGKNYFGTILKEEFEKDEYRVCMLRLTEPLYNYAIKYFNWDGKEESKPRELLQNLGSEVIKDELGLKDFLINRLREDILILDKYFDIGIITDGRLIYEFDKLKEYYPDIKIIKMERDFKSSLTLKEQEHITEKDLDKPYKYDYVIKNTSTKDLEKYAKEIEKKEKRSAIAIDGMASTGKSTICKEIAKKYPFVHIDTGSMYRAFSLYFIREKIDYTKEKLVIENLDNIDIEFKIDGRVFLNKEDVTDKIRTEEISKAASIISTYKDVREKLVNIQKRLSKRLDVVMDGRDIGSVVLKDATLKVYLVALKNIRAERRFKEYKEKNIDITIEEVEKDLEERDYRDTHRENSPLIKVSDAIEVDNSYKTIDEVVDEIMKLYEEKRK